MTVIDPAFEGVGQEEGMVIWRIEDFEVRPIPKQDHGNFFNGDSYILLKTTVTKSGRFEWNIHFWIGEESTQDECGTAAIKSVELDDVLGGSPVQHREVQNHESPLFLSYFKKGIRYLQGGAKSGFHHVVDEHQKRLLRVKGRRNVRMHEMPLSVASMNNGDCFILDTSAVVFAFVGAHSGRMERIKAIQAANAIRDDVHCGRSVVKIIDATSSAGEIAEFFEELGEGTIEEIAEATPDDDQVFETNIKQEIGLYRVSEDDSGTLQVDLVAHQPLKQEYLQSNDCFILDSGLKGLFVWIGKESSRKERVEAMNFANKYVEKNNYPKWLPVQRIVHNAETPEFKSYFTVWKEPSDQIGLGTVYSMEEVAKALPDGGTDVEHARYKFFSKSIGKALSFMPDDGSGEVEIWRVENFDLVPVDVAQRGVFFGGDSYIVKYTYHNPTEQCLLYFWLGQASTQDERATAAIMTVKMDNDMSGKATQIRVVHGQEPEHFLRIFKGNMVVLSGGHASGFKNIHDYDSFDADGIRLFQIRGTNHYNTRAEQVPEKSASLNSNDVFILETPSVAYLWIGEDSCNDEQEMGRRLLEVVSPGSEVLEVKEGEEPEELWASLGGKEDYPKTRDLPSRPYLEPRLFRLSDRTGKLLVEEVCHFSQEDLCEEDVMILDAADAVYLWIGKDANDEEKNAAHKLAENYLSDEPSDRSVDSIVVITIKQGSEPEAFKALFSVWNPSLWEDLSQLLTQK